MAVTRLRFIELLVESGLIPAAEATSFAKAIPGEPQEDGQALAREFVRTGKLTKYQATAIYQGKSKGLVFGEYTILDKLGQGGMGLVFMAQHRRMKRTVAVKVLPAAALKNKESVDRFYREVEAAARLMNPNIVTAHDAGEIDGMHFLVMEYVDGQDLSSLIEQRGPLDLNAAIDCIQQTAKGLEFAHSQGVVHRDIKPGNLLLDKSGTVKILDMGLARISGDQSLGTADPGAQLTQSGQIMGTVDYMSPEQAEDTRSVDHRTDIYSLGCTLYRLLTGQPPYPGDTVMRKLLAHREAPIPSLREARPELPIRLEQVFRRMVAKRREDRQQSMTEVLVDLEGVRAATEAGSTGKEPSGDSALYLFLHRREGSPSVGVQAAAPPIREETIQHYPEQYTDYRPVPPPPPMFGGIPTPPPLDGGYSPPYGGDLAGSAVRGSFSIPPPPPSFGAGNFTTRPSGTKRHSRDHQPNPMPMLAKGLLGALVAASLVLTVALALMWTLGAFDRPAVNTARPKSGNKVVFPSKLPAGSNPVDNASKATVAPMSASPLEAMDEGAVVPPGYWIDVLAMVRVGNDLSAGDWRKEADGLHALGTGVQKLEFPLTIHGGYEIEIEATVSDAGQMQPLPDIILPTGGTACQLCLGHRMAEDVRLSGLQMVDDRSAVDPTNPARNIKFKVVASEPHLIVAVVRPASADVSILITVDGGQLLSWQGNQSRLSVSEEFRLPFPELAGLVFSGTGNPFAVSKIRLKMISGEAQLQRTAPPGAIYPTT